MIMRYRVVCLKIIYHEKLSYEIFVIYGTWYTALKYTSLMNPKFVATYIYLASPQTPILRFSILQRIGPIILKRLRLFCVTKLPWF